MAIPPTTSSHAAEEMANRMDYISRRSHGEAPQTRLRSTITERQEDLNQRMHNAGSALLRVQEGVQEIVEELMEDAEGTDISAPERAQFERLQKELQEIEENHATLTKQLQEHQGTLAKVNETDVRLQNRQKELEQKLREKEAYLRRPNKTAADILSFGSEVIKKGASYKR